MAHTKTRPFRPGLWLWRRRLGGFCVGESGHSRVFDIDIHIDIDIEGEAVAATLYAAVPGDLGHGPATYRASETVTFVNETMTFVNEDTVLLMRP